MFEIDKLNRFLLDNNFIEKQSNGGNNRVPTSIFFNAKDLFQAGMTEEEFISQYEQVMAGSVFGIVKDETKNIFDISSISDEDLKEIEDIAKKYFQSIDKDGDGTLTEEEVNGIASKDGDSTNISNDDVISLTNELFIPSEDMPEKENTDKTEKAQDNNNITDINNKSNVKNNSNFNLNSPNNHSSNLKETQENNNNTNNSSADINEKISKINKEITSLNEQKKTESVNNEEYSSLISQSQEINKNVFASEGKIEQYTAELHTVEYDLSAAKAELNNTQDAQIFEDYQSTINQRKAELQSQINTLQQKQTDLKNKINEEEKNLKALNKEKQENDNKISEIEANNPNAQIDSINTKINELNKEKAKLQAELTNQRKQELSDAEVYGKAQAYRNSELVSAFLNPLTTKETKAKYDEYYYRSHGYSYCDQFVRNGVNDFYSSVLKEMGISEDKIAQLTAEEKSILQSAGFNASGVAGSEYVRECADTKQWGKSYQAVLDKLGIDMKSSVDITNMSDEERKNAVREGKIYPGMTFLTLKNGQYHVGMIESINKDLSWNTIEGNTSIKYADGTTETGTVGSHKSDGTNQYLQGLSDVMAKVYYWMKKEGYSDSEIKKHMYKI